jgi:hypothetical protein
LELTTSVIDQSDTATVFLELSLFPAALFPFCAGVPAIGVGQPVKTAAPHRSCAEPFRAISASEPSRLRMFFSPSAARAVGHPVRSVADVRRTDARCRTSVRPAGVTQGFQVSEYKVDPRSDSCAGNLLANHDWRSALLDEPEEGGPKVPLISKPNAFACRGERLARATASPYGSI